LSAHQFSIVKSKIVRKLLAYILLIGVVFSAVISTVEFYGDLQDTQDQTDNNLLSIGDLAVPALVQSAWTFDRQQLQIQIESLSELSVVSQVRLELKNGEEFVHGQEHLSANSMQREYPLIYEEIGKVYGLGTLYLSNDFALQKQQLIQKWGVRFLGNFFLTIFMALVIGWLFQVLVTRRVLALRDRIYGLTADEIRQLEPSLPLESFAKYDDEISDLSESIISLWHTGGDALRASEQIERELRSSEERFNNAMRGANDGLWDWNLQTNEVYYSPRWFEMLGYKEGEFDNSLDTWGTLVNPEDKDGVLRLAEDYIQGRTDRFHIEMRMRHKDGHWVDVLARAFLVKEQSTPVRMVGTHVDITERKNQARALREVNLDLEKKVQERTQSLIMANQAKSQFLANMSHEIRTPMNAIIGMSHLALKTDLDDQQRNYISKVSKSAEGLLGILNDILDFSKIEAGKLELELTAFQLKDVISHMMSLVKLKSEEKSQHFNVDIEKDVPGELIGDALRIGQVLVNLANNAVKFTPDGGFISVFVSVQEKTDKEVILLFMIEDSGIGLSSEEQDKLFQSFSQADSSTTRKFGGSGLGLAISSKLVDMMQGRIWVESEKDKGSRFYFTVRLGYQEEIHSQATIQPAEENVCLECLNGARILLVEDNEFNQELAMEVLQMKGITVAVASNGQEALDILETNSFDGVLMDCQMPVLDGYEATRRIRKQDKFKGLPVIALTANAMKGDKEKVLAVGMNDYVTKPFDPEVMFATLAKWIKSSG
jgi:PAS domain S-box-containing protein